MTRTRLVATFAALLLGSALVGACGSASKDAAPEKDLSNLSVKQLLSKASTAVQAEKYVTLTGTIKSEGKETGLDLSYVGSDSHGTITLQGARLELETVAGKTYFKPSDDFWTKQMGAKDAGTIIKLVDGRWIVADAKDGSFAQLTELASREFIAKQILTPDTAVSKGDPTKVDGVAVIPLKTKDGIIYLDRSTARPVQIMGTGTTDSGKASFSYAEVDSPTAPTKAQQVDLSKLAG